MMRPKSLQEAAPNLFGAIVASDIRVKQLKAKVTKEVLRSPSTRSSLIEDLLVMCAKRHFGNEGRMGLDAVMCEVPADAKARISKVEQAAQKEWQSLVAAVEIKLRSSKTHSPMPLGKMISVQGQATPAGVEDFDKATALSSRDSDYLKPCKLLAENAQTTSTAVRVSSNSSSSKPVKAMAASEQETRRSGDLKPRKLFEEHLNQVSAGPLKASACTASTIAAFLLAMAIGTGAALV